MVFIGFMMSFIFPIVFYSFLPLSFISSVVIAVALVIVILSRINLVNKLDN